jgi:3-oxoacyl-[acyl-carrier protein] reductase
VKVDLTGRVALVTGGTRGIGRAIAESLAKAGARVAVVGRNADRAHEAAAALSPEARGYACDLGDTAAVAGLIESVERDFGAIDILVNNAGLNRDNLLMRLKDEDWDVVIDANLRGAFATMRAATRGMMKRRWGRIINISSVVGRTGQAGQVNYAASKAGLIGMTRALAREVASRGITVNAVAPGYIETPMTAVLDEKQREVMMVQIPLGRPGTDLEIAQSVAFLASDGAAYITGHVLDVNGGMFMGG